MRCPMCRNGSLLRAVAGIVTLFCLAVLPLSAQDSDRSGKVFVLPIQGPIDKSLLFVFRRAFQQVERLRPDAIIIEIDTPGGALKQTEEIVAWMRSSDIPMYAFVNPRALSAGAIISLGADKIFMSTGSRIGSAMPIMINPIGGSPQDMPEGLNEKILSDTRSLVRGLAQENDHDEDVAMAMVDRSLELRIDGDVICAAGELLNLTAEEAIRIIPPRTTPLLATAIVDDLQTLLEYEGLEGAEIIRFEEEAAERLARFITMLGPIFLALGLLGLYIEIRTPGFGLPGIAGISLLIIYFFGHYVAGLAGLEDIALVLIGFVLLALEVFVIPGFGIPGILGITCIVAGLVMGMIPYLPSGPPPLPGMSPTHLDDWIQTALLKLLATLALCGIGIWFLAKILPKTAVYARLVLGTELSKADGYVSGPDGEYQAYLGKTGQALTPLHPSGIVMIDDNRVDVVSNGDMIARGTHVKVVEVEGARIIVEPLPPAPDEDPRA